jgi:Trypsin-co-occurring domain 2
MSDENGDGLELATMIAGLREELKNAALKSADDELKFQVLSVELEASVEVSRAKTGNVGVKFYVVEAGGAASVTNASVQRVRLTLAVDPDLRISSAGKPS